MSYMHFTTQQLQGGPKYSVKAKIGNWYEDMCLDEIKFKDYISAKESNKLESNKSSDQGVLTNVLNQLQIQPFPNGILTTGAYLMLRNLKTNGAMVIDVNDKNLNYSAAFAVTTSPNMNFPSARSLFRFEKYTDRKDVTPHNPTEENTVINYGDKISILAYPGMYPKPLYLYSCLLSPFSFSRFSRNQEVLVNVDQSYNNCWCLEHPDQSKRYSVIGQPVSLEMPFIIRHCATGGSLASDMVDYFNNYGHEYEISCKNFLTPSKYQKIEAEKDGKLMIDDVTKTEELQNMWIAVDHI